MRSILSAFCLVHLVCALALPAQGRYVLGAYLSRNGALPDEPTLAGGSLTVFALGPMGVRGGGGVDIGGAADSRASRSGINAWTTDADLVLAPLRASSALTGVLGGFAPFGFIGVGLQGTRQTEEPDETYATWSYGFGASRPLVAGLSAEAEARHRTPFVREEQLLDGFERGWEYRIGLSVSFGGNRRSRGRGGPAGDGPVRIGDREDTPRLPRPEPAPSASAARVLSTADRYLGTRYRYGGTTPASGFDCSGFVQYVFAEHGVSLPRTSRQQALAGRGVVPLIDELSAGDLVLFAQNGTRIDHVAIYAGRGRIIHSTSSGGSVRYDDLSTPRGKWFVEHMVAARRVLVGGGVPVELPVTARVAPDSLDPPDHAPVP